MEDRLIALWNDFKISEISQIAVRNSNEKFYDLNCQVSGGQGRIRFSFCTGKIKVSSNEECKARSIQAIVNAVVSGRSKGYRFDLHCPDLKGIEAWWTVVADWNTWESKPEIFHIAFSKHAGVHINVPESETNAYIEWNP